MHFLQVSLNMERTTILLYVATKSSNFQVNAHFTLGLRNFYSQLYYCFLLNLIRVRYVWNSKTKQQVRRPVVLGRQSLLRQFLIHKKPLLIFLSNKTLKTLSFSKKTLQKTKKNVNFKNSKKVRYFWLLQKCEFGLFCQFKVQFIKNVV